MGGGAGVEFTINIKGFSFTVRKSQVVPSEPLEITRWDCTGYEDGMTAIRGDMLKVTKFMYEFTDEDKEWLERQGIPQSEQFSCRAFTVTNMEWAGYRRGKWQDAFPMTLTGIAEVESLGDCDVAVEVDIVDREEFAGFWEDVFNSTLTDEDVEEYNAQKDEDLPKLTLEEMHEIHEHDNRMNYGAGIK